MPDQDQEPNAELRHERMARGMGAICRALRDMPAGPKKKRAKAPAKKAKNRSEGYNLQNRRPSGNYQKHRQVLPLDLVQAGEAEWFIEACGKTVSHGGARGTIAGSTTLGCTWKLFASNLFWFVALSSSKFHPPCSLNLTRHFCCATRSIIKVYGVAARAWAHQEPGQGPRLLGNGH